MTSIDVRGLTKRYGPRTVVDDLSFTVPAGWVTGFLGPNGAGKSTTMRMIMGLAAPSAGAVTIGGRRYRDLPVPLTEVGALLDAGAVHGARTAHDHLLALAASNGLPRRRVGEVLGRVGLDGVAGRRVGGFSLGMRQRLGIAATLLGDPRVLIFDEPVNGLDPEGIRWIRDLMRRYAAEGRTVLISSHLMSEMALTADHLIVIGRGRIVADQPLEAFLRDSAVLVRAKQPNAFVRPLQEAGAELTLQPDGALIVTGLSSTRIGEIATREDITLTELTPRQISLEDAFMDLTAESVEFTVGSER